MTTQQVPWYERLSVKRPPVEWQDSNCTHSPAINARSRLLARHRHHSFTAPTSAPSSNTKPAATAAATISSPALGAPAAATATASHTARRLPHPPPASPIAATRPSHATPPDQVPSEVPAISPVPPKPQLELPQTIIHVQNTDTLQERGQRTEASNSATRVAVQEDAGASPVADHRRARALPDPEHFTFKPRISSASRRLAAGLSSNHWEARRRSKRERVLREAKAEEVFQPRVNKRSAALVTSSFFERQQQFLHRKAGLKAVGDVIHLEAERKMHRRSPPVRIAPLPPPHPQPPAAPFHGDTDLGRAAAPPSLLTSPPPALRHPQRLKPTAASRRQPGDEKRLLRRRVPRPPSSSSPSSPSARSGAQDSPARRAAMVRPRRPRTATTSTPPRSSGPGQHQGKAGPQPLSRPQTASALIRPRTRAETPKRTLRRTNSVACARPSKHRERDRAGGTLEASEDTTVSALLSSRRRSSGTAGRPGDASPIKTNKAKPRVPVNPERLKELRAAREARDAAVAAVKECKVFTVCGRYQDLRNVLQQRGWVEKLPPREDTVTPNDDFSGLRVRTEAEVEKKREKMRQRGAAEGLEPDTEQLNAYPEEGDDSGDRALVSRALCEFPANLIWTCHKADIDFRTLRPQQTVNHFRSNGNITTKCGLAASLANVRWTSGQDEDDFYPRCYYISSEEQFLAFVDDYRLKAAVSVLKQLDAWSPPAPLVEFALKYCQQHLDLREHLDLDEPLERPSDVECETLLQFTYQKLGCDNAQRSTNEEDESDACPDDEDDDDDDDDSDGSSSDDDDTDDDEDKDACVQRRSMKRSTSLKRRPSKNDVLGMASASSASRRALTRLVRRFTDEDMQRAAKEALAEMVKTGRPPSGQMRADAAAMIKSLAQIDPQLDVSGFRNVWVVKPAAKSRGRGIFCENRLDFILPIVVDGSSRERWVAQKYIERPLLIRQTKFDIRQWVVVTKWVPLTVWMYQDSYLRFSSVPFTLSNLHSKESKHIHLCNNSIQKVAEETATSQFAPGCMWTSEQLKHFLANEGRSGTWDEVIMPQLKDIIVASLASAQDNVEGRKNAFELFGFDFMIDEDYKVWLLEINSSPDLSHSTAVTAQLVEAMFEDLVKLVIDRKANKRCDTGRFERIHRGPSVESPLLAMARDLVVEGTHIARKRPPNMSHFSRRSQRRKGAGRPSPNRKGRRKRTSPTRQAAGGTNATGLSPSVACLQPSANDPDT